MVYAPGGQINATDYNGMVGNPTGTPFNSNKVLRPFANSLQSKKKMAGIYGIGFGDRGYGQTGANLPVGQNLITASHWSALRTTVETAGNHQGTDITNLVPASQLVSGQVINAHDGSNYSLNNLIEQIDKNRFNTNSGKSMTLSSNVSTDTRSLIWSEDTITSTFRYTWSTVDEARYFFNSGGELRIRLTQGTVSTPADTRWNDIFTTKLGTYSFRARNSAITGTSTESVVTYRGYYDLANSSTFLRTFNSIFISENKTNLLQIHARIQGTADHGGPGTQVDIRVSLRDRDSTLDQISVGTTYRTDIFRATAVLAGIVAPSISINDTFD